jgi:chromosome partitioning protein
MRTLAIANAKGGVGKTTLAVHLAVGLAQRGKRVLLVDLDPQGHATAWLLGIEHAVQEGTFDAILGKKLQTSYIREVPGREDVSLLPSTQRLSAEDLLSRRPYADRALAKALEGASGFFDYGILDCPPQAGFFMWSAFVAAEALIAPVTPAYLSLSGLRRLEELVGEVSEEKQIRMLGYVLFGADPREGITAEARGILENAAKDKLFRNEIRISTAAKALPASKATAWDGAADERGREDYAKVLRETLARLGEGR